MCYRDSPGTVSKTREKRKKGKKEEKTTKKKKEKKKKEGCFSVVDAFFRKASG